jgi:transmembrane sensor
MSNDLRSQLDSETAGQRIRERAARWAIARREHETWTENNQVELENWLAQSPVHMVSYLRIQSAWDRADRLVAMRTPSNRTVMDKAKPLILRFSAAVLVLAIVGFGALSIVPQKSSEKVFSTPVGGSAIVTLADGSQIELNTSTAIRVSDGVTDRKVWLERGEAYFSIKHDPSHPLIVLVNGHRIVDIGTKFLIKDDGTQIRVSLIEGSINFESASERSKSSTTLEPGDVIVATANSLSMTRESVAKLADELGWRTGLVIFKHTTLSDAVVEINRYGRKKVVIADPEIGGLRISGAFPVRDTDLFARVARIALGVRVEDRRDAVVISR